MAEIARAKRVRDALGIFRAHLKAETDRGRGCRRRSAAEYDSHANPLLDYFTGYPSRHFRKGFFSYSGLPFFTWLASTNRM
jgi:hypothetical protein